MTGTRRIALWGAIAVVVAGIVAATFWSTSGGGNGMASPAPKTPTAQVDGTALVIGAAAARMKVVVYEDFGCAECGQFEQASRDYLHQDAAAGRVLVEYRPFQAAPDGYSMQALTAWAAVLSHGTPAQALRFHDLLYDEQPSTGVVSQDQLAAWAKRAGADDSAVVEAIGTEDRVFVTAANHAAGAAGVRNGLGVVVNGKPLHGDSGATLAERLETMIAGS